MDPVTANAQDEGGQPQQMGAAHGAVAKFTGMAARVLPPETAIWEIKALGKAPRLRLTLIVDHLRRPWGSVNSEELAAIATRLQAEFALDADFADASLEVTTPGAERALRSLDDYRRFAGNMVKLTYFIIDEADGRRDTGVFELWGVNDRQELVLQKPNKFSRRGNSTRGEGMPAFKWEGNPKQPFYLAYANIVKGNLHVALD